MSDHHIPALRRRFLEDMRIKGLLPKTQTMYLRAMREFTRFLGHSPDAATPEELRAFQLDMKERGVGAPTFNNRLTVVPPPVIETPRCTMRRLAPPPQDPAGTGRVIDVRAARSATPRCIAAGTQARPVADLRPSRTCGPKAGSPSACG